MEMEELNLKTLFTSDSELKQVLEYDPVPRKQAIRDKLEVYLKNLAQKRNIPNGDISRYFDKQKATDKKKDPTLFEKLIAKLSQEAEKAKKQGETSKLDEKEAFAKEQKRLKATNKNNAIANFLNDGLGADNEKNIMRFIQVTDETQNNDSNPYNKIAVNLIDSMIKSYFIKKVIELSTSEVNEMSDSYMSKLKLKKRAMDESFKHRFNQKNIEEELRSEFEKMKSDLVKMGPPERKVTIRHMVIKVLRGNDNAFGIDDMNDYRPTANNMQLKNSTEIHNNKNLNIVDFFTEYFYNEVSKNAQIDEELVNTPSAKGTEKMSSATPNALSPEAIASVLASFFSVSYAFGLTSPASEQSEAEQVQTSVVTAGGNKEENKNKETEINKLLSSSDKLVRALRQKPEGTLTDMEKEILQRYNMLKELSQGFANQEAMASENQAFVPRPNH